MTIDSSIALDRTRFFIDGVWTEPKGAETHLALEAATEKPLGRAALGSDADIDAAVRAARRALDEGPWGRTTAAERAATMRRFAEALAARAADTATLVSRENGMPIGLSNAFNGDAPTGLLTMYADQIAAEQLEEVRPSASGSTVVRRAPVGVVAAITPWNYPQVLAMMKIAPAARRGLHRGAQAVAGNRARRVRFRRRRRGSRAAAGRAEHRGRRSRSWCRAGVASVGGQGRVHRIHRRGPDDRRGMRAADPPVHAGTGREIGGHRARRRGPRHLRRRSRQRLLPEQRPDLHGPVAHSRPRSRYAEVVDAVAQYAREMVLGDPLDPAVTCGPMASKAQLDRVLGYLELGRASDARLVAGGGRPAALSRGWFVEPTVFADVDNRERIAQEEIFGPVVTITPYEDEDDAVRLANDSEYGLGGSVWTTDEDRGLALARRVRTGTIGLNYYLQDLGAPFGGMKGSGVGRELGPEALDSYLEFQSVYASAAQL